MRILKLKGRHEATILKEIEKEYGERAIVINTQKEETAGLFKWMKAPKTVVTIAIKETLDSVEIAPSIESNPIPSEPTSYELLLELKNQVGELHQELDVMKQQAPKTIIKQTIIRGDEVEKELTASDQLAAYMKERLLELGIQEEICERLLEGIEAEESEAYIRQLYDQLENLLVESPKRDVPQIIFFVGSTGVGKTTTIAKLTAKYVLEEQKKVVLFTSDTYRIAAVEQLKTYADILGVPIEIIYDEADLPTYIKKWEHVDHILIDTAGRSHKNTDQVKELGALLSTIQEKQVYLAITANTSVKDISKIIETYEAVTEVFELIMTKLDETDDTGNLFNLSYHTKRPVAYLTTGQNVPADIQPFDKQQYISELLGRLNHE